MTLGDAPSIYTGLDRVGDRVKIPDQRSWLSRNSATYIIYMCVCVKVVLENTRSRNGQIEDMLKKEGCPEVTTCT